MVEMALFGMLLAVLFVGGLAADHILPRIGLVRRFVDGLPMCGNDDDLEPAEWYEMTMKEAV